MIEEYNLKFTKEQLDIIVNAIIQRPYIEVASIIVSINKQLHGTTLDPKSD